MRVAETQVLLLASCASCSWGETAVLPGHTLWVWYLCICLFLFLCCGYQMLGEASPVNIVLKLNQLVSLLSSIEEKVHFSSYFIASSCHLSPLVMLLLLHHECSKKLHPLLQ